MLERKNVLLIFKYNLNEYYVSICIIYIRVIKKKSEYHCT